MKKLFSLIFFLPALAVWAQDKVQIKFAPLHVDFEGTSIRVDIRKMSGKVIYHTGLGYLINPSYHAKEYNAVYVNKAWADNLFQHFIVNVGIERSIRFKKGIVRLYPFIEFSLSYTGLKNESYDLPQGNGIYQVYTTNIVYPKTNVLWLINHTGVGCDFPVSKKIFLAQELGLSPAFVKVYDKVARGTVTDFDGLIQPFYSIGITYTIK